MSKSQWHVLYCLLICVHSDTKIIPHDYNKNEAKKIEAKIEYTPYCERRYDGNFTVS